MKKKSFISKIITVGTTIVATLLLLVAAVLAYLCIREYKPEDTQEIEVENEGKKNISPGDRLTLLTFNIGYGALDSKHDFFMDGGKTVTTESKEIVADNIEGITDILTREDTDVVFIQEIDTNAKRSYHIDETNSIAQQLEAYNSSFAINFKCDFIPYPVLDPIGKVESGIMSLSKFPVSTATRIALPSSFSWPVSIAQLKRCLLVSRVPLENSDKELVLINLHLEAYDDGEGKIVQTKILSSLIEEEYAKGNYCIAGGDFNQSFETTDTSAYTLFNTENFMPGIINTSDFVEGCTFASDNAVPTSRLLNEPYDPDKKDNQYYVIDGYILSPNVTLKKIQTLDESFAYSDHNPVKVEVVLEK